MGLGVRSIRDKYKLYPLVFVGGFIKVGENTNLMNATSSWAEVDPVVD